MAITDTPNANRPLWKRMSVIGAFIISSLAFAEGQGMIPPGVADGIADFGKTVVGPMLAYVGIYRHVKTT